MSFAPTTCRPFARAGGGGEFRGSLKQGGRGQIGTLIPRREGGRANFALAGVTCAAAGGAPLGGCRVDLFVMGSLRALATTTSDTSGNFRFEIVATGPFFVRGYSTGTPDLAGVTVNNLMAT